MVACRVVAVACGIVAVAGVLVSDQVGLVGVADRRDQPRDLVEVAPPPPGQAIRAPPWGATIVVMSSADGAAVIFDLDGVLIDSRSAISGCINHALAARGLPVRPRADLFRYIGPPLAVAFADLLGEDVQSEAVAACVATYRVRYAQASLEETAAVPGIAAVLAELAADCRLAVATSKPLAFAWPLLDLFELGDRFQVVARPDLRARSADKAETVAAALRELGTCTAVMVGDRSFDVLGAHANGIPAIGVTWGIGDQAELASAGAELVIDLPAALPGAVRNILGRVR